MATRRARARAVEGSTAMRIERDALGEVAVPRRAYYGAQTQRAVDNFGDLGPPLHAYPRFVEAIVVVKKAAVAANARLGELEPRLAEAILGACDDVISGRLLDEFVVSVLAPADTSHNMNANEVVANRANELLGGAIGDYSPVHPLDHVNRSQSTNDVMHTAVRLASRTLGDMLCVDLRDLERSLRTKAKELGPVVKVGRTCLQDALPITFGSVFHGYASSIHGTRKAIERDLAGLK